MIDGKKLKGMAPLELRTTDGRRIGPRDYTSRKIGNA
jgi:hypothetical protein